MTTTRRKRTPFLAVLALGWTAAFHDSAARANPLEKELMEQAPPRSRKPRLSHLPCSW
jgi:hypothetical protein